MRYREKLFTFLRHDGVPWNNNNAEHAIKPFARDRAIADGVMSEHRLRDYLVLLSLYQTCKYRGISFLRFLLSGEEDLDKFHDTRRVSYSRTSLQVYRKRPVNHVLTVRPARRSGGGVKRWWDTLVDVGPERIAEKGSLRGP